MSVSISANSGFIFTATCCNMDQAVVENDQPGGLLVADAPAVDAPSFFHTASSHCLKA